MIAQGARASQELFLLYTMRTWGARPQGAALAPTESLKREKSDFLREVDGNFHAKSRQKPPAGGTIYSGDKNCHTRGCGWHAPCWHDICCAYEHPCPCAVPSKYLESLTYFA